MGFWFVCDRLLLSAMFCFATGASIDFKDGFVGCMRGLIVNGVVMDMRGKVERGEVTYGVSAGQNHI